MKKGFAGIIMLFVGLTIAIVLVSTVVLPQVFDTNTDTWDTGTIAMWSILGIAIVALLLLMIFKGK
jgi:hypothetical protein